MTVKVNARLLVAPPQVVRTIRGRGPYLCDPDWLASVRWPPPPEWFDPDPPPPDCAFEIGDDGRVRGRFYPRGARLGSFTPKPSPSRYATFHTWPVEVEGGTIDAGLVSIDHPAVMASAAAPPASAYPIVAKAYDDAHGGYVCGALRPDLTRDQVEELRSLGGLSGRWDHDGSGYDLTGLALTAEPALRIPARQAAASAPAIAGLAARLKQKHLLDEVAVLVRDVRAAPSCGAQLEGLERIDRWRRVRLAALDADDPDWRAKVRLAADQGPPPLPPAAA